MATLHFLLLVFTAIQGCHGFQSTGGPDDNAVLYFCPNETLTLPWDNVLSPGETAVTEWYFHGHDVVLIATFTNNQTAGEAGNYSVVISGQYRRAVLVQISDVGHLMTSGDQLLATVKAEAIYINDTGLWSLVLSCGKFVFLGGPPFDLEWVTPSGAVVPSTEYKDGEFHLHVQTVGDYACRIPEQAATDNCMPQLNASIHVSTVEMRLAVLEHHQHQQHNDINQLETQTQLLEQSVQTLQSKDSQLEQSVHALQSKGSQLDQLVQSLQSSYIHLDLSVQQMNRSIQHVLEMSSAQPVAFHAWLNGTASDELHLDHVETNVGNAYSRSTGRFTPPRAGLYYFAFSSTPADNSTYLDGGIWREGSAERYICVVKSEVTGEQGSCHAAVHLSPGDSVYAFSNSTVGGQQTAFTGFLLAADR